MDKIFPKEPVEEESYSLKRFLSLKHIFYALIILVLANLIYLDIVIFQGGNAKVIEKITSNPSSSQDTSKNNDETFCSQACITKINEAGTSLNKATPTSLPTSAPTKAQQTSGSTNAPKEYYVPFGSGSGSSSDWQDVSGLQANVDSAAYGTIKSVVFEASLHVPTGNENAAVRLYNATDNHPVWYSQLDFTGNTSSVFLSSNKITLDAGNKLYKVQLKTQLQFPAVLDQSRLHITAY
jgi:hypothetical protein